MDDVELKKYLLSLNKMPGLGSAGIYNLYNHLGQDFFNIKNLSRKELNDFGFNLEQINYLKNDNEKYADEQLTLAKKNNIKIITILDNAYPDILKQIYDPPLFLFYKGNINILKSELFAVVGTRKPTLYGKNCTTYFCSELLANGYIVVSGYALGIDITAHLTIANQLQPTVAVLGTSLDYIYPMQHNKYVNKILDAGGVFISESLFTTPPLPSCFPRRNRIISGLSKGTLVVEAARKSGSLITAKCAAEQGREVFAVPGNINNQQSWGCLDLIANGAKLTMSIDDILHEADDCKYPSTKQVKKKQYTDWRNNNLEKVWQTKDLFNTEQKKRSFEISSLDLTKSQQLLYNAISGGVTELDSLVNHTNLNISELSVELLQLELKGVVVTVPGGYALA